MAAQSWRLALDPEIANAFWLGQVSSGPPRECQQTARDGLLVSSLPVNINSGLARPSLAPAAIARAITAAFSHANLPLRAASA